MAVCDQLMNILACPKCEGPLRVCGDDLACSRCALQYPVRDGIPILLAEAATDSRATSDYAERSETDTESIQWYDTFYAEYGDYRRYERADVYAVSKLFRHLRVAPGSRVLDLGTGTGYFADLIAQETGCKVVGADFSVEGLRQARERYGLACLAAADAYALGFKPNTFDVVLTVGLTPFKKTQLADVTELIQRITRPLRSGGHYVFIWSTNLSGEVQEARSVTDEGVEWTTRYYNLTRRFVREAFIASEQFQDIEDYAFIRPVAHLIGGLLFTKANTWLTELLMKVMPRSYSARLLLIGRKR